MVQSGQRQTEKENGRHKEVKILKIYISGPITGHDAQLVKAAFDTAEKQILDRGHQVVNPYKICESMPEDSTWKDFMREDIPQLVKCDAIYMLHGWVYSSGCNLEYSIATTLGLLVYDEAYRIPYTPARRRERRKYGNEQKE